jgi:Flp pilus assembly protein TadB
MKGRPALLSEPLLSVAHKVDPGLSLLPGLTLLFLLRLEASLILCAWCVVRPEVLPVCSLFVLMGVMYFVVWFNYARRTTTAAQHEAHSESLIDLTFLGRGMGASHRPRSHNSGFYDISFIL